ncbi:MAG: hypothetical protein FWC48_04575 [Actinomycetia bacterium]|nr:hypothetical protein [Actinomycetes bacterium]
MMKRFKHILTSLMCALILATIALPAGAATTSPDAVLTATFDGTLHLSPPNVMVISDPAMAPGQQRNAVVLLKNNTSRTVEFALVDVIDRASTLALDALDVSISIDGGLVYSGSCDAALGYASSYYTVAAGGELPVTISYGMRADGDNRLQGSRYLVDHLFEVRAVDGDPEPDAPVTPTPPGARPQAPARSLPAAGDLQIAWIASALFLVMASALLIARARRLRRDEVQR